MALQHRIPFLPDDAKIISQHIAVARLDGRLTFFDASGPILTFSEDDETSLRFAAAMLSDPELGLATPKQVGDALGRHRSRIHDYRKRLSEGGADALQVRRRGPKGASKLKGTTLARAQKFLNEGKSNRKVAELVGVSEQTIRKGLKEDRLVRPKPTVRGCSDGPEHTTSCAELASVATTPGQRSDEDASCEAGVGVKRNLDRSFASLGLLVEAKPDFQAAESVAKAGVLVALPALLGQGLLDIGEDVYGGLKKGYYGLTSVLLLFGFMALLRMQIKDRFLALRRGVRPD